MSRKKSHMLKADMARAFLPKRMILSVTAIVVFYCVACMQLEELDDVFSIFWNVTDASAGVISLIICAIPYATAFCEDWEHGFVKVEIVRCGKKSYTVSKLVACFASAVITCFLGETLFVLVKLTQYPIVSDIGFAVGLTEDGSILQFIVRQDYLMFFFMTILIKSLLAGIMATIAMVISLFIKNKIAVLSMPMIIYYFGINIVRKYLNMPIKYIPCYVYNLFNNIGGSWTASVIYAILYTLIVLLLLYVVSYHKIRREFT